jgi:hypothetical protein
MLGSSVTELQNLNKQQAEDFEMLNNAFSLQNTQLEIAKSAIALGLTADQLNKGIRTHTPFSTLDDLDQENAIVVLSKLQNRIKQVDTLNAK